MLVLLLQNEEVPPSELKFKYLGAVSFMIEVLLNNFIEFLVTLGKIILPQPLKKWISNHCFARLVAKIIGFLLIVFVIFLIIYQFIKLMVNFIN